MALDKQDFKEIKKIVTDIVTDSVNGVEKRLGNRIEKSEKILGERINKTERRLDDKIEFLIEKSEMRTGEKIDKLETKVDQLDSKLDDTKQEILQKIDREITDTAGVNRAQIKTIVNHDRRITKIEKKIGIAV